MYVFELICGEMNIVVFIIVDGFMIIKMYVSIN